MHTTKSIESKSGKTPTIPFSASTQITNPEQTGEVSFFPGGIYIAKGLIASELHQKALRKLAEGLTKTVRLEKIHNKGNVYSIRASKEARIMGVCAPCAHQNNQSAFFVFAFYDKHQYNDLKFLPLTSLQHPVVDLDFDSEHTQLIKNAINQVPIDTKASDHWNKAHYINSQVICFSDQQKKAIHTTALPVIVTGAAGSGKTLIIIKILHDLLLNAFLDSTPKNYIYIAPTERLADEARRIFNELLQQGTAQNINLSFVSIEQFILSHKPQHQKIEYRENLMQWLKVQAAETHNTQLKTLLANLDYLIEEFKTMSILSKEQYIKLGAQQSLFRSIEEKTLCYELYVLYKKRHPNSCQILFPELKKTKPQFDLVIIDEGQTCSIKQLKVICECARDGRFMIFGDPLQNFSNKISVFPQLKQIIRQEYHQSNPIISLQTAYRNPLPVIHFANDIIYTRRVLAGGIDDDCESLQLIPSDENITGQEQVEWLTKLDESQIERLTALLNQPNTMLITNDDAHLKQAQDLFGQPLILFPEYIQGLEATTVFVYCPFSAELIKKINTQLKNMDLSRNPIHKPASNTSGTPEFTSDLNQLFTVVTRVAQTKGKLIVYMGEHDKHHSEVFFNLIKRSIPEQSVTIELLDTKTNTPIPANTKEEWEEWIKNIYRSGNKDQALELYLTHVSKDRSEFNKLVNIKERLTNQIISTKLALPSEQTSQESIFSQKSKKNNSIKPTVKTQTQSNTNLNSVGLGKTTLFGGAFSDSDRYIHQLLENCTYEKLSKFMINKNAKEYLLYKYKPKTGNQGETLFESLLNSVKYLNIMNTVIYSDPFTTHSLVHKPRVIIGAILGSLRKNPQNAIAVFPLLYRLVEQQPAIIELFSVYDLNYLYIEHHLLTQPLLEKICEIKPEVIIDVIRQNANHLVLSSMNDFWCIKLLQSRVGCGILVRLYELYPALFSHFNSEVLIKEMAEIMPDGTHLFFWLNTTAVGQELFKDILSRYPEIKNKFTSADLFSKVNDNTEKYFNGTSLIFWLLIGKRDYQILSSLQCGNNNLIDLDQLIEKEVFTHPDYQQELIYGKDLLQYYQGILKSEEGIKDFIPVMLPVNFIMTTAKYFTLSGNEQLYFTGIVGPHASRFTIDFSLKTILALTNAESLLFDYPLGKKLCLFEELMANPPSYKIFLNILKTQPKYCKLITIERLQQCHVGEKWIDSMMTASIRNCKDEPLLPILFQHNPELIDTIHQLNVFYPLNACQEHRTKRRMSLFDLLCLNSGNESCLEQLVPKEQLIPQFFSHLLACSLSAQTREGMQKINNFEALVHKKVELLYSWLKNEPRLISYLTVEHLLPENRSLDYTAFNALLYSETGTDFLIEILKSRIDILNTINRELLCLRSNLDNSALFFMSLSERGCELLYLFVSNGNNWLSPQDLEESLYEQGNKSTVLSNLINNSKGVEVLHFLVSNPIFAKSFNPEKIIPFSTESAINCMNLCQTEQGKKVIQLVLEAQPQYIKKITKNHFYGLTSPHHSYSLAYKLLSAENISLELFELIIKNNPSLIDASELSSSLMTKSDRIGRVFTLQHESEWFINNEQVKNFISDMQDKFTKSQKSVQLMTESNVLICKTQNATGQDINTSRMNAQTYEYLNGLLGIFTERNLMTMLKNKKADQYLLTSLPDRKKTLFEIILDNPDFLKVFNAVLKTDGFLATGILIADERPINSLIDRMTTNNKPNEQHIKLFELLINIQPNVIQFIIKKFTSHLLFILSSNESGRNVLYRMALNRPDFFEPIGEKIAKLDESLQEDWFGELLESQLGCTIISLLFASKHLLKCISPHKLAKRTLEYHQQPIYFWLSSTSCGQKILCALLDKYPQLVSFITELTLTKTINHHDPLFHGTSTLFWLTKEIDNSQSILDLIHTAGNVPPELLQKPLSHPVYLNAITNPKKGNSEDGLLISGCFLPYTYSDNSYGSHSKWTQEEVGLINRVLSLKDSKNVSALTHAINTLLKHKNAESLLFDSYKTNQEFLFSSLMQHPQFMMIFMKILKDNPKYFSYFSLKQLNRCFPNEDASLLYYLTESHPDFLGFLLKNYSFNALFNAELLLKPIYITKEENQSINWVTLSTLSLQSTELLKALEHKRILTPSFASELFKLSKFSHSDRNEFTSFLFSTLFITQSRLIKSWIDSEPRLLNYITEEHMISSSITYLIPTFCYALCMNTVGIDIFLGLLERKPQILKKLSFEHLISNKECTSLLYQLSSSSQLCSLFIKIISNTPELFKDIRPKHFLEKAKSINGKKAHTSTLLDNLLFFDSELTIMLHFMSQPDFLQDFKPYDLLNEPHLFIKKNGKEILSLILQQNPQAAKLITKDLFYKCRNPLNLSLLTSLLNVTTDPAHILDFTLIDKILISNPALINLSTTECLKLSTNKRVLASINILMTGKEFGLTNQQFELLNDLYYRLWNESKDETLDKVRAFNIKMG